MQVRDVCARLDNKIHCLPGELIEECSITSALVIISPTSNPAASIASFLKSLCVYPIDVNMERPLNSVWDG